MDTIACAGGLSVTTVALPNILLLVLLDVEAAAVVEAEIDVLCAALESSFANSPAIILLVVATATLLKGGYHFIYISI